MVYPVVLALIVAVYVVSARLGLSIAFLNPSATPVWPPTGIALAALLVLGRGAWPVVFLGAWLANAGITGWTLTTLGIATGNTLEAVIGAWLVERFAGGCRAFERIGDLFRFVALAAFGSTTVSATIGVMSLMLGGFADWPGFGPIWLTWWLGDIAGNLIVAPPLLLWATPPYALPKPRRLFEAIALLVLLSLVAYRVLVGSPLVDALPLKFICIPFLIWAAIRFNPRFAASAMLLLAAFAIWGILQETASIATPVGNESLLVLQTFLGLCSVISLALAALAAETRSHRLLLEERVAARTQELSDTLRRLQETQDTLVRREKTALLGRLSSGVGHELRNPLGVMSNAVYYLEQVLSDAPERVREHIDILRRQITLTDRIVGNLLDAARVDPGRSEPVSLSDVVQHQMDRLEVPDVVDVRVEIPGDLPPVQADEVQVGQVVFNVLTNAVQAVGEKGGILTIRAGCETPERARLEIADTGPGIQADDHEKIFEPLYSTKARGIGLGLSLSRALARANAGDVTVATGTGAGATFMLTLPIFRRPVVS